MSTVHNYNIHALTGYQKTQLVFSALLIPIYIKKLNCWHTQKKEICDYRENSFLLQIFIICVWITVHDRPALEHYHHVLMFYTRLLPMYWVRVYMWVSFWVSFVNSSFALTKLVAVVFFLFVMSRLFSLHRRRPVLKSQ